jgi:CRISPR-associated protein Cmr6
MTLPFYREHNAPSKLPTSAHKGLWFERFFNGFNDKSNWAILDENAKKNMIESVSGPSGSQPQLEQFQNRQLALVDQLNGQSQCFKTDWHFVTGMGNPHPVENGFSWHSTLAVPYLMGSTVKGLVRAWVEMNEDESPKEKKLNRLKTWFGSEEKGGDSEQVGAFIFFDATPQKQPMLICDIMTPHMGKWYESGGKSLKSDSVPGDWHDPTPIPFLAVKNASFVFHIAPRQAKDLKEVEDVFIALSNALMWLGAGAKTAAGYGYMTEDENFKDTLKHEREQALLAQAEKERLSSLSPIEQEVEQLLKENENQVPQDYLLNRLREGHWKSDEDICFVASKVQAYMEEAKAWFPDLPNAKKNLKKHKRTREVMDYLKPKNKQE